MRKLKLEELGRISVEEFKKTEKIPVIVVLDDVRSLHNVGAVFRSSDAFLIRKIYLCGITGIPPHKEIRKSALGSTESVDWEYRKDIVELLKELKTEDFKIISIEQTDGGEELQNFQVAIDAQYAIIFGNEVEGVQQKVIDQSDFCLEIPQGGTKHSLNISVCAGIVLWNFFRSLTYK